MATGNSDGRFGYLHPAQLFLQRSFGLDSSTAVGVVQDVLLRLFRTGPKRLNYPKRYLFRACRWRALRILRSRRRQASAYAIVGKRRKLTELKNREALVALEDEDKPKFFGQATLKQQEVLRIKLEGRSISRASGILEIPDSKCACDYPVRKNLNPVAG